jgi:hypothetical protein
MNRKERRQAASLKILVDFALDTEGCYWWKKQADGIMHGPFASEAEAQKDFETKTFGPNYVMKDGGQWDPAWDKKQ